MSPLMSPLSGGGTSQAKVPTRITCLAIGYSLLNNFNPFLSYTIPYFVQIKGLTNFQVFGACSTASAFVYQAYLFVLVTESHFQTMTSISQASACAAIFVSAELGQVMVLIGSSLNNILYVTIASVLVLCILSFLFPKKQTSKEERPHFAINLFRNDRGFLSTIKETWADRRLQLLSLWWAFALAGFELTINYGTTLFEAIDSASTYYGQVVSIGTALAVLSALSSVYLKKPVEKLGGFLYIFGSLIYGTLTFALAYNRTLWLAYFLYIVMVGLEKLLICFVYAQCGSLVKNDRYALMFSLNCCLGQAAQAVIQALLEIAGVDIFTQYIVLGSYFFGIVFVFGILYGLYLWKLKKVALVTGEDDVAPKLMKVDPLHQPLIDNEIAAT